MAEDKKKKNPDHDSTIIQDPLTLRQTDTSNLRRITPQTKEQPGIKVETAGSTDTIRLKVVREKKKEVSRALNADQTIQLKPPKTNVPGRDRGTQTLKVKGSGKIGVPASKSKDETDVSSGTQTLKVQPPKKKEDEGLTGTQTLKVQPPKKKEDQELSGTQTLKVQPPKKEQSPDAHGTQTLKVQPPQKEESPDAHGTQTLKVQPPKKKKEDETAASGTKTLKVQPPSAKAPGPTKSEDEASDMSGTQPLKKMPKPSQAAASNIKISEQDEKPGTSKLKLHAPTPQKQPAVSETLSVEAAQTSKAAGGQEEVTEDMAPSSTVKLKKPGAKPSLKLKDKGADAAAKTAPASPPPAAVAPPAATTVPSAKVPTGGTATTPAIKDVTQPKAAPMPPAAAVGEESSTLVTITSFISVAASIGLVGMLAWQIISFM